MEKLWQKKTCDEKLVDKLAIDLGVSKIISQLLVLRGINTFEDAKSFFRPEISHLHDPFLMKNMQLASSIFKGVLISKVLDNSAAELAGIKDLDVILEINGIKVNSTSELHELIIQFNPGDEINCTIQRKEKIETFTLSLKS